MNNIDTTVVSSRVRLARNLAGYPFPGALKSAEQGKKIVNEVFSRRGPAARVSVFIP